jgi:hypothetical protein
MNYGIDFDLIEGHGIQLCTVGTVKIENIHNKIEIFG